MRIRKYIPVILSSCMLIIASCKTTDELTSVATFSEHALSKWNKKLTRVIISDVFSPPVCSRIYAYANIAAYEALVPSDSSHKSFAGKLKDLKPVPLPLNKKAVNY